MNYELALELKEAGFPLTVYSEQRLMNSGTQDVRVTPDGDPIRFPTLSELIEACGEDFYWLIRGQVSKKNKTPMWEAKAVPSLVIEDAEGLAPEEAVANLWLELNEV